MNNTEIRTAIEHETILRVFLFEVFRIGFCGTSTGALSKNMINIVPIENQNSVLLKMKANEKYFAINAIAVNIENEAIRHL
ncbi:hypothetical protein Psfp_02495 [Pelotomaculum sp. FP]|uniref:hypothetical protein n=1 Tax=Pelotomaculum sp. FP TaxID=261474 RepID=UPI001102FA41|nr:hypothetical protein [Pelotomaculum sp. FP]TEB14924.1 hypothetical protein Psfp_02495 [Pelotomaculum sp. FP]